MKDLGALAFITGVLAVCCIVGMGCALFSHWLTLAFYRIGATETPAAYLAYLLTLLMLVFLLFAVGGRITTRVWFWQDEQ